jgi:ATP-dependent Clp protease ATP-binding subunit ClpC
MFRKFRLFIQKHHNGNYTATVPGIHGFFDIESGDDFPESSTLASHGPLLEEVRQDIREALEKWLTRVEPSALHRYDNYREGARLEKVELELRPAGKEGKKRHEKLRLKFSLLVNPEDDGQYLVSVPKLQSPPLSFYCYSLDELKETASREIASYFSAESLEELLQYRYERQEFLDETEVSFTPLKPQKAREKKDSEEERDYWAIRQSGINLTALAKEGKCMRAWRREKEVQEILSIISADRNSSVILIGPSDVGKTAVVHEVARRMAGDDCPQVLEKRTLWHTGANQLIAGCSYIGEWQDKIQNIVEEVRKKRHILFIDDIAGLTEAGRWSKGDENMASFLKPYISDGTLTVIGETTTERYSVGEAKEPAFLNQFRTLRIEETSAETTQSILGSTVAALERDLNVKIAPGVTDAAMELTRRFQPYRSFPGKAISFLERLAGDASKAASREKYVVTRQFAMAAFARATGLPEFILSDHLAVEPSSIERFFSERIIGQPAAVTSMVDLITVIKAGLNDPAKPLGCFFFVGPTGVGKTEMAKALAEYLFGSADRMLRYDMSEYAEPFNAEKLIGSPHGSSEGELTRRIRLQPFSVILLDEFEKAHYSIFDVFLQVLGEGRLTDGGGRTADFRSSIIIMTSNLGASPKEQRKPGLRLDSTQKALESHFTDQVEQFFRPEFVNRLDRVVVFDSLNNDAMRSIAAREVEKLLTREGVTRRNILVDIHDDVMEMILEKGFSPLYGARPLKREIERQLIVPLARHLVAHRALTSQLLEITCRDGAIQIAAKPIVEAREKVLSSRHTGGDLEKESRMNLEDLGEAFANARLRAQQWEESDTVREMRNEWQNLLGRTRERDFVAYDREAQKIWERIAHLDRLMKRVNQLREKAEYLEEFTSLAKRQRDSRYRPDLAQSLSELLKDLDYLEIELLTAHLHEKSRAIVVLSNVGRLFKANRGTGEQLDWILSLVSMYLRWARRKGYHFEVYAPGGQYRRWVEEKGLPARSYLPDIKEECNLLAWNVIRKSEEFQVLLRNLGDIKPDRIAFAVEGSNVYGFLKGEEGAHKCVLREEGSAGISPIAHVKVICMDDSVTPLQFLNDEMSGRGLSGDTGRDKELPEVIRLYVREGDRMVKDLRTGMRTRQVTQVLDGAIDEFILAYLKSGEAADNWESKADDDAAIRKQ